MKSYKPKEILKILKKDGFVELRQVGSHLHLYSYEKKLRVSVPMHNKNLKRKTLVSIIKSAGLDI